MSLVVSLNMCARLTDFNYGVNCGNMCVLCCKMKNHFELIINKLKSSQLIIKILQEELQLTSTVLKKQGNVTNVESHSNSESNVWKVFQRGRAPAMNHARLNHVALITTGIFPSVSNHYYLLGHDLVGDDAPISTHEPNMVTSKFTGKSKAVQKNRVSKVKQYMKQHKVIIVGDSHARNCATKVSQWLNNDFEVMGFVNPGSGMKYIKGISREITAVIKEMCVVVVGGVPMS